MGEAAFHGFAGEVVKAIEPHSETDPVALLSQLLACSGNIFGRERYYRVESDRHHPNLFVALVGQSSRGRKGTSLGRVRAITKLADPKWVDECVQGGLSSGEGLIYAVRDPKMSWDEKKQAEVKTDLGVDDKRLFLVEPEFAGLLWSHWIYGVRLRHRR